MPGATARGRLLALCATLCSLGAHALVGGSPSPSRVMLDERQRRAIGRLMVGDETLCTGWLVSARHLVTAGHCFSPQVGAGQVDFLPSGIVGGPRWPVVRVARHPSLDVAVAVLGAEVPDVEPLVLNDAPPDDTWVGDVIELAGSGYGTLPSLGVTWGAFALLSVGPEQLTVDGDERRNACRGDSGGPWLRSFPTAPVTRVVALISQGAASCEGSNWGPRIDLVSSWVRAELAGPVSDSAPCEGTEPARCEADVSKVCTGGWWRDIDCAASGRTCGWKSAEEGFACLPRTCGDRDGHGRCDRGVASWCGPGGVEQLDCHARGLGCGWADAEQRVTCEACTACDGQCVELETDAQHCGACNRPCDGRCEGGRCMTLAASEVVGPPARGCAVTSAESMAALALVALRRVRSRARRAR